MLVVRVIPVINIVVTHLVGINDKVIEFFHNRVINGICGYTFVVLLGRPMLLLLSQLVCSVTDCNMCHMYTHQMYAVSFLWV